MDNSSSKWTCFLTLLHRSAPTCGTQAWLQNAYFVSIDFNQDWLTNQIICNLNPAFTNSPVQITHCTKSGGFR
eukprot:1144125-Pelagomonas_calceolata.AAC.7